MNECSTPCSDDPLPALLECMTLRLHGHAAYDKGLYVPEALHGPVATGDPLPRARQQVAELCGLSAAEVAAIDEAVEEEVREAVAEAMAVARPKPPRAGGRSMPSAARAGGESRSAAVAGRGVKNGDAVRLALEYILANKPTAFLAGLDIGVYGSAFKTCKGLIDRFGPERVIDMPLCESGMVGFAWAHRRPAARPIIEFQFADFSTEVGTQLGLNAGTWFFRSGQAPRSCCDCPAAAG